MLDCKYNLTHAKRNVWLEGPSQLLFHFSCEESKVKFNSDNPRSLRLLQMTV